MAVSYFFNSFVSHYLSVFENHVNLGTFLWFISLRADSVINARLDFMSLSNILRTQ